MIPEAMRSWGGSLSPHRSWWSGSHAHHDEQGIDVEALRSIRSGTRCRRDLMEKVIALQNEKLAQVCAAQPDRFVAMASVALQFPDLAVQQLETAVKKYGMRGVAVAAGSERSSSPIRSSIVLGESGGARRAGLHPPAGVPQLNSR